MRLYKSVHVVRIPSYSLIKLLKGASAFVADKEQHDLLCS